VAGSGRLAGREAQDGHGRGPDGLLGREDPNPGEVDDELTAPGPKTERRSRPHILLSMRPADSNLERENE
jgi:hypothetical protein